jgi:hypothetical protein
VANPQRQEVGCLFGTYLVFFKLKFTLFLYVLVLKFAKSFKRKRLISPFFFDFIKNWKL